MAATVSAPGGKPGAGERPEASVFQKSLKRYDSSLMRVMSIPDNFINRPLAFLVVKAVLRTRITPNQVSIISGILGLAAALLFWKTGYGYIAAAGILAQVASVLDGADGMLARIRNRTSEYGAHLDLLFDRIVDFAVFTGTSWAASGGGANRLLLVAGLIGAGLYQLEIHLHQLLLSCLGKTQNGASGAFRAIVYHAILVCALLNRIDIFVVMGFAATAGINIVVIALFFRLGIARRG
jgi:hypothetical protein